MTIHVTQDHIKRGERGDARCCPLALALQEAGFPEAMVGPDSYQLMDGVVDHDLPDEAFCFVWDFDNGSNDLHPFSFEISEELLEAL